MYFQYLFSPPLFFLPNRFLNGIGTETQTFQGTRGKHYKLPPGSPACHTPHNAPHKYAAPKLLANATLRHKRLQTSQISYQCEKGPFLRLQRSAQHEALTAGDRTAPELQSLGPGSQTAAPLGPAALPLGSTCASTAPSFLPFSHILGSLAIKVIFQMVCVAGKYLNQAAPLTQFQLKTASQRLSLEHTLSI